jgi:hypothetical protein
MPDNSFSSSITTMPYPSLSPVSTSSPIPTPTVPEFSAIATLLLVIACSTCALLLKRRKITTM